MNLRVPDQIKPIRLDKFLIERFPHTSRHFWRDHLREWVRIDGKLPSKGKLLHGGEVLALKNVPPKRPPPFKANPKIHLNCLFEDEDLFVIDKPAGLPCLPLREEETGTVMNGVLAMFPEEMDLEEDNREGGMIHRLDNETSGALLFAKNRESKNRLSKLNHEGKITKEYLAWVEGHPPKKGVIPDSIAHHPKNSKKMVVAREAKEAKRLKARPALTQFEALKETSRYSLLRIGIHRGARHQIRVHLAAMGHPVVGDILYGSGRKKGMKRHLLHAFRIIFPHPTRRKKMDVICPAPGDFHP